MNEASESNRVLVLRSCPSDRITKNGFQYPESGWVEAPDWDGGKDECGGGLHGFPWGCGNGVLANWSADAAWLVISVDPSELVEVTENGGGKCKFRGGFVVFCGDRKGATDYLLTHGAAGKPVIGCFSTSGDRGTSTSGYGGTSTSGDRGASTSGYRGTSTSGDRGTSTSGYGGTSTSGNRGTSTSGDYGTSTSGYGGTSTSGYRGTSTSGDGGTSTSGYGGTSTSGDRGTSTSGNRGVLVLAYRDSTTSRRRLHVAYVGEDGIKPNTPYRYDVKAGRLVEVKGGA